MFTFYRVNTITQLIEMCENTLFGLNYFKSLILIVFRIELGFFCILKLLIYRSQIDSEISIFSSSSPFVYFIKLRKFKYGIKCKMMRSQRWMLFITFAIIMYGSIEHIPILNCLQVVFYKYSKIRSDGIARNLNRCTNC